MASKKKSGISADRAHRIQTDMRARVLILTTRTDAECDGYSPGTKVRVIAYPHNDALLEVVGVEVNGQWIAHSYPQLKYIRKAAFPRNARCEEEKT